MCVFKLFNAQVAQLNFIAVLNSSANQPVSIAKLNNAAVTLSTSEEITNKNG